MKKNFRTEYDSLGKIQVPKDAYYAAQTQRAIENFPISQKKAHPEFIRATAMIKKAAAEANVLIGKLDKKKGTAISKAAQEIIAGKLHDQFVVDVFQAGAGTSHHMNANEVIANRAIEFLGGQRGAFHLIHPNDHVNMSQSTNDVFPTAMRLASLLLLKRFFPILDTLADRLEEKGKEFFSVIKSGRTHLQDAVPIRLGQEFSAYAKAIRKAEKRIHQESSSLTALGIGGTAVGTGLNTHPEYRKEIIGFLAPLSGLPITSAEDMIESMQSMADFVSLSSSLKELAIELIRIANDLRLLSSGPTTGFNEINLPPVQPGSSIMPGKVNPVMAEVTNMVCFRVIGNDLTIVMAAQAGQMELNVMMPVINDTLLCSIELLTNVINIFTEKCIAGITVNRKKCERYLEHTVGLATILNQVIGYEKAGEIAKEAVAKEKSIREILVEKGILSPEQIEELLDPQRMI